MDDNRTRPYLHIMFENDIPEYRSSSTHHDSVAERGMPLATLISSAPERNALIEQHFVPNLSCFADDDAHSMIDKQALADFCTWMDLNSGEKASLLRNDPRYDEALATIEPVRDSVQHERVKAGVAEQDFQSALCGGILSLNRPDVLA
jgi:hypothetical protein